ncbi:MAG: CinA family nicotinamide mononucleotide deamidase-related protein [Muribaculaceae bacterium]|nr:CinA family nicotinamide mononucleotide deamidase-related protein [Muribaculaceae bacterium]
MRLSIVIIGDEILLGRVTDTNSGLIARTLGEQGWTVAGIRTVGDNADDIRRAIADSMAESTLTVTTGGLGPTRDDITKAVMTDIFGGTLVHDDSVAANVERIFAERGLTMNELTRRQALVPSTCRVIQNRLGTAPVMWFEKDGKVLAAMPGVPFETRGMLPEVAAEVHARFGEGATVYHREFTVTGITESGLAERLSDFEDSLPEGVGLAYLPSPGEIVLRLDAQCPLDETEALCTRLEAAVGPYLAGRSKLSPAEILLHKLRRRGYTLATAESCTGGNIAHLITAVPGCSDTMLGGVVSYANEVKTEVLGVSADDLSAHGAVSETVVRQMAEGVRRATGADCSVATSGIAGPGGGSPDKPVGTVWIAASTPAVTVAEVHHFSGDREAVIDRASAKAMMMLGDIL